MALVIPFTFIFGADGSPFQSIDPSTNTREQDVSEYGCLNEKTIEKHESDKHKNENEAFFFFCTQA